MLSARTFHEEVYGNHEAYWLSCAIAASGEAQGGPDGFARSWLNLRTDDHGPWMHRCRLAFDPGDSIADAFWLPSSRLYGR
jgi:hypothetical protein